MNKYKLYPSGKGWLLSGGILPQSKFLPVSHNTAMYLINDDTFASATKKSDLDMLIRRIAEVIYNAPGARK